MNVYQWVKAAFADPARVTVCDSCSSVWVCEIACRAEGARERAEGRYLTVTGPLR